MNRHQLTYLDLNPQPITSAEPSGFAIWCGAAAVLGAVYLLTVIAFSL
jgi:hypothetical protein